MRMATTIAQRVVWVTGATQVILGILFWTNRALVLLPLHMLVGMTFVIAIWVLTGLAAWSGLQWRSVLLSLGWGFLVPVFGATQARLLPGTWHWLVEVTHLLIGLAAMAVANWLAAFIRQHPRVRGERQRAATGLPLHGSEEGIG